MLLIGYSWVLIDRTKDMRKVLLGFGLVVFLSACGTGNEPVVEAEPESVAETSEQSLVESDVIAEPEEEAIVEPEPVVEPEPEIDGLDESSVVESTSGDMDFATCVQQQAEFAEAISSSGNYNVIPIVDTEILSMVKFCTNDDSVFHTCSAPDNKIVVTKSTNRVGC